MSAVDRLKRNAAVRHRVKIFSYSLALLLALAANAVEDTSRPLAAKYPNDAGIAKDPAVLFAPLPELRTRIHDLLRRTGSRPGHIFNLGHGILPETPVENVKAAVEIVREFRL